LNLSDFSHQKQSLLFPSVKSAKYFLLANYLFHHIHAATYTFFTTATKYKFATNADKNVAAGKLIESVQCIKLVR